MTEESFQRGRKVMQKGNYLRGKITEAKGNVARWTAIEDSHRQNMRPEQADGAKKMVLRAINRLEQMRKEFDQLEFPESNIISVKQYLKDGRNDKTGSRKND